MNLLKIFKKESAISYESLPSREKKKIMEKALHSANKEQFEVVKAYRESCCGTRN